jgi:exodeoxyribonuclease VII large subunit
MTLHWRIDLTVPFAEKEDAKAKGARWDRESQTWYAPPGANLGLLKRWLPFGAIEAQQDDVADASTDTAKGVDLAELLARVNAAIDRGVPEPVWVRAEISELRGKNGHLYLTLVQRNERGDILAQSRAIVWRDRATAITHRFEQATGAGLKTDIKILCLAQVRFDVLYGLSLIIEDVDPSFTLGDLAAKLARIREELERTGLYDRNRLLPAPADYVRVAVISPATSAGLGDFRRETDRLHQAGLCSFRFFEATFQGLDAPSSIGTAIRQALAAHRQTRFDALVIIRGGGSVTDLAWLNDLELAVLVCKSPIPVITGIGHERDSTILDEIAQRRFDTPSKVALHITSTIRDHAFGAIQSLERIHALVSRIVVRETTLIKAQADRIQSGAWSLVRVTETQMRNSLAQTKAAALSQMRFAVLALEAERGRAVDLARGCVRDDHAALEQLGQAVCLKSQSSLLASARELAYLKAQIVRETSRMVAAARHDVEGARESLSDGVPAAMTSARRDVEQFARIVVGMGPESTLQRGFAIARDNDGRPLTSRRAAMQNAAFRVQFRDGTIAVTNEEFEGGGG